MNWNSDIGYAIGLIATDGNLSKDGRHTYNDSKYPNSRRLYVIFLSASDVHIRWLQYQIKRIYKVIGKIRAVPRAWTLVYAKNESKVLLRAIYYRQELPFLYRKKQIVEDYL